MIVKTVQQWMDTESVEVTSGRIDWLRIIPFIFLHVACLGVFFVGVSPVAILVAVLAYALRMFAITAFYHRYFAHKAFRTSRPVQFVFALLGAAATQRGPMWWAAHHRDHHKQADAEADPHQSSRGFWWSHLGWFLSGENFATRSENVKDWQRYPELRWLDRYDLLVPVAMGLGMFVLGAALERWMPQLQTSGLQMLVWGYFISTVVLMHATLLVNSMAHRVGHRRFATSDQSRNNWWLALLTFGEGWHNNHHRYAGAARQGFYWWQIDVSYLVLRAMAAFGLVWDLKPVPQRVLQEGRRDAVAGAAQ